MVNASVTSSGIEEVNSTNGSRLFTADVTMLLRVEMSVIFARPAILLYEYISALAAGVEEYSQLWSRLISLSVIGLKNISNNKITFYF